MKRIAVLGSTGSIGTQTLEIVRTNKDIKITALAAGNNIELLEKQIREFKPSIAAVWNEEKAAELKIKTADLDVEILSGMDGLLAAASWKDSQIVVTAIVGMIGILPTIEAIKAGKDIALANKETLVTAGHIIMPLAEQYKVSILPVDSEHSAIFQSLQGGQRKALHKILLTASGGPFRGKKREELTGIQVEDALKHPNWEMGQKITIDSSTMVNKGLEVIEAKWLFDVSVDQIQVVVQPQSIIHSMVEYEDGAVIAQLGTPDSGGPCPGAPTCRPPRLRPKRQPPFWSGPGRTPPGRKPGLGCWPDIITRPLSPTSPLPPGAGGCGPIRFPAFSTNFSPWEPAAMRPSSPGCSPISSKRVSGWGIIQTLPWPGWSRPSIPGSSGPPRNRSSAASPPPSRRPICRRCCR